MITLVITNETYLQVNFRFLNFPSSFVAETPQLEYLDNINDLQPWNFEVDQINKLFIVAGIGKLVNIISI